MPDHSFTHRAFLSVLIVLAGSLALMGGPARAQQTTGQGILLVTDWPDQATKRSGRFDILPFIDTFSVAYQYRRVDSRPELSFVLEWQPADRGIYHGRRVALRDIDGYPAIVALELSADVISQGKRVAEFSLIVDSMIVAGTPDIIRIDVPDLSWNNVFVDADGDAARDIFEAGFELRNPTIVSAGFAVFEGDRQIADTEIEKRSGKDVRRPPRVGARRPRNVSIYRHPGHIDIGLDLFWLIGSGHTRVRVGDGDGPRENIGRGSLGGDRRAGRGRSGGVADRGRGGVEDDGSGEEVGVNRGRGGVADGGGRRPADAGAGGNSDQGSPGDGVDARGDEASSADGEGKRKRSGARIPSLGGSGDDDDDDDEDDETLVPYAIAAVAAAGVLAVVGGTVGYYGSTRYAPLGLTSGIVRDDGGLLLQVGVNEALIAGEGGPKRLMGRLLSFGNLFGTGWVQPAFGAGVLATSRGGEVKYEPSVSLGGVIRHNMILFYGGYDVMKESPEFSLAVDLRRIGFWGNRRD